MEIAEIPDHRTWLFVLNKLMNTRAFVAVIIDSAVGRFCLRHKQPTRTTARIRFVLSSESGQPCAEVEGSGQFESRLTSRCASFLGRSWFQAGAEVTDEVTLGVTRGLLEQETPHGGWQTTQRWPRQSSTSTLATLKF